MNTLEELQSLLDRLDQVAGANTIVSLYLPAVTYEGDLIISGHAANLIGAMDEQGNAATTIEGMLRASTERPDLVRLSNIRVIGPGSGTGLTASVGVVLEQCTFSGWDVGAVANRGSYISAHYSTFDGNGVGLRFQTTAYNHCDTGFIFNTFTNNGIGRADQGVGGGYGADVRSDAVFRQYYGCG